MDEGVKLLLELADVLRQINTRGNRNMTRSTTSRGRTNRVREEEETPEDPWAAPVDEEVEDDPWGTPSGGGSYPSLWDLIGSLILLEHVRIEEVDRPNARPGKGETQDRLTADTTVIHDPQDQLTGVSYDEMFWSQGPIVSAMQKTLRKGKNAVLGRLARVDVSDKKGTKGEVYWDADELKDAMKGRQEMEFAWILEMPSEADKDLARKFLKETRGAKR